MSQEFRVQRLSYPELLLCGAYLSPQVLLVINKQLTHFVRTATRYDLTPHCSSFAACWHRAAISPGRGSSGGDVSTLVET